MAFGNMNCSEMIKVLEAIRDRKPVEVRSVSSSAWSLRETTDPPNFKDFKYRVKPEPLVVYINVYNDDDFGAVNRYREKSEKLADHSLCRTVKFIEVVE